MASPELERDDLAAALGARRELGREAEHEVLESFLDRVGTAIDARVEKRLAEHEALCGRLVAREPSAGGGARTGQAPSMRGTLVLTASLNVQPGPSRSWVCHLGAPTGGDRAPA